jgi:hypothetical protein
MALLMGYPEDWFQALSPSPTIPQAESVPALSQGEPSHQPKQQSHSAASSASTVLAPSPEPSPAIGGDLVLGEKDYYASVIPLEPEEGDRGRSPTANNYSAVLGEKTSHASGWLEKYTKTKRLKDGILETYPLIAGKRDPNQINHWYWAYRWEQKRVSGGFTTRAVSLPKHKVEAVELAIALRWSVEKILSFIRGEELK